MHLVGLFIQHNQNIVTGVFCGFFQALVADAKIVSYIMPHHFQSISSYQLKASSSKPENSSETKSNVVT